MAQQKQKQLRLLALLHCPHCHHFPHVLEHWLSLLQCPLLLHQAVPAALAAVAAVQARVVPAASSYPLHSPRHDVASLQPA
jgi:hypothetical protein